MSYATQEDATNLYGEVYVQMSIVRDETPDLSAFDAALAKASSEIDSYLGTRYDVPLSTVPAIVQQCCIDIAIYKSSSSFGGGLTEEKRTRYDDAIKWLLNVAKGLAGLGLTTNDDTAVQHLPEISYPDRLFSRSKMAGL